MKKVKIYDCFLFFQEIELLKLRLDYLYDHVDFFIIVESAQTFSGREKEFEFQKIKDSISKFEDKIIYFKNEYFINSYESLREYLSDQKDKVSSIILDNMDKHNHYKKNELNWVIDTFQREAIKYPLFQRKINKNDIILFSDLDEIPSHDFIDRCYQIKNEFITNRQFEFSFRLNILSNKNWYGTIASNWENLKSYSLNSLRLDVRQNFLKVKDLKIHNGGYHFTSYGSIKKITKKIISMGHQEFNNFAVKFFLAKNIDHGMDIFGRSLKSKYQVVDINDNFFFDPHMQKQIKDKEMMIANNSNNKTPFYYFFFFVLAKIARLIYFLKN